MIAPPADHLGVARLRRPECEVCHRAPATSEAAPHDLPYRNDPRAVVRVCDDVDCRNAAKRIVLATVAALEGRTSSIPPCRLETGVYPAARGGR